MGSDQETISLATDYLDIIFFGTFIFLIQISLNGTLNAQGDTKSYRNVLIVTFFLNIGLNPLFIFGLGPITCFWNCRVSYSNCDCSVFRINLFSL